LPFPFLVGQGLAPLTVGRHPAGDLSIAGFDRQLQHLADRAHMPETALLASCFSIGSISGARPFRTRIFSFRVR
jgi:hypothetical protein